MSKKGLLADRRFKSAAGVFKSGFSSVYAQYRAKGIAAGLIKFDIPNLIEVQKNSYDWFWQKGLKELFDEFSPIRDWSEDNLELYFLDYRLEEPKYTETEAKARNVSYEASLYCRVKLVNKKTKEEKEQEIFMGDFPLMTERGTFLVNAVERVVISQLIRSAGVLFVSQFSKGQQFFGAKVIPNRGAWLEFETDSGKVISVKIDRKRKTPVTSLLRVFAALEGRGNPTDDEIKKIFAGAGGRENDYIEATIAKDPSKTAGDSFVEIYKRIRPGDLATEDNARSFIEAMFSFERYDLGEVGRWKISQRLGLNETKVAKRKKEIKKEDRVLSYDDLAAIIKEIISLNNTPGAKPDDIDHLGNRRVRSLGELLQNKLRLGMARTERVIRDRMSTQDVQSLVMGQLINVRPFAAAIKEFFSSSQLSQFMDQRNPLDELEHKRRLSAMGPGGLTRERAGFEVRDVHSSHYGRICPIETSEGPNIGLIGHLTTCARLNEYGFIETPYRRVVKGKITKEIVYLDAFREEKYNIAHASVKADKKGNLVEKEVEARVKGQPNTINRLKVDFIDVLPQQPISVATSLIPFLEHDDSNRALMGSNMQRQAVSCVRPQAPLVGTGIEEKAARDSGNLVIARENGKVEEVDANGVKLRLKNGKIKEYPLRSFVRTNQYTCICQRPVVEKGQSVKAGDILSDGPSTEKGRLALGQNLLVAFLSWRGNNFEDAIILSEKLVKDDRYTSVHIESFPCDVRETKLGPEITTPDIPNVGEERLKDLDEEGIVRIGAEVGPNDILVGKISPKGETDLTAEERLLQAIFGEKARDVKDTSLRMPHGKRGRVVGIKIFSRDNGDKLQSGIIKSVEVEVAQLRKVSVGDKLAGRHGNKGIIAKVLPEEDMPYLADGTPVDIVLNPLGVASRMNIGQILETHLGWAANKLGYYAISPSLAGLTEEDIKGELRKAGLSEDGKVTLYDGRNGEPFERPTTVGYIYMLKLLHLVEDKIHMRSVGPYSLITQQPLGGKAQFGGQRFGEMEVWALEGYGAAYTLQEMLTIKSDDVAGRAGAYDAIIRGRKIQAPNVPASFNVLVNEMKALGLNVELVEE
ncbi:MAG: DNA-directed RNA polymerase subunit beta [Candidatus Portnoybacteria bacterium CG_4_8_14_3_um_filter_44_15]|uniref:DNA-directed RNA polymerase subunit beta n=3 Tax=Candidatus Portnoyibacteriota TaxID=1817913 RepID=A0A2M7IDP8_9BACT|nr:MAG: DNA-directed RNA polymerase subunit beta [Candidatus Portnoybacteria bacterium CG_4_8_14_3_um_filter_44_15]